MPTVLREKGFRFFFYSAEGAEPMHIHIARGDAEGKIWLEPVFEVAFLHEFTRSEEKMLLSIVLEYEGFFKQKWNEYFGQ